MMRTPSIGRSDFLNIPKSVSHSPTRAIEQFQDDRNKALRLFSGYGDFDRLLRGLRGKYPWLEPTSAARFARAYGTRAEAVLGDARGACYLGIDFGAGLFQAEIDYLISQEFALTSEDILRPRSKRGLHLLPVERTQLGAVDERITRIKEEKQRSERFSANINSYSSYIEIAHLPVSKTNPARR